MAVVWKSVFGDVIFPGPPWAKRNIGSVCIEKLGNEFKKKAYGPSSWNTIVLDPFTYTGQLVFDINEMSCEEGELKPLRLIIFIVDGPKSTELKLNSGRYDQKVEELPTSK